MSYYSKYVLAEEAAQAMGGFSTPRMGGCFMESLTLDGAVNHARHCPGTWSSPEELHAQALERQAEIDSALERVLFWTHTGSAGYRDLVTDPGSKPVAVVDDGEFGEWLGWEPKDVQFAFYRSASSDSGMRYTRTGFGFGELEFVESPEDPTYRGAYFGAWKEAEELSPLKKSGSKLVYSVG